MNVRQSEVRGSDVRFRIRFARLISAISAPPLMLLLTASSVCKCDTENGCWNAFAVYTFVSVAVPLAILLVLRAKGLVGDFDLTDRRERAIPLLSAASSSALAWVGLFTMSPVAALTTFAAIQAALLSALFVVSLYWKISIHAAGMAALLASVDPRQSSAVLLILFGLAIVGWARVVLGKHTIGQFIAGGSLSATVFAFWRVF